MNHHKIDTTVSRFAWGFRIFGIIGSLSGQASIAVIGGVLGGVTMAAAYLDSVLFEKEPEPTERDFLDKDLFDIETPQQKSLRTLGREIDWRRIFNLSAGFAVTLGTIMLFTNPNLLPDWIRYLLITTGAASTLVMIIALWAMFIESLNERD